MIKVGQVMGAFGTEGAVKVVPLTDFEDRFEAGQRLLLGGIEREVLWSRDRAPGLVLKLSGIDNRTLAEMHSGGYLEVAEPRPLPPDSFYHHQLVGRSASRPGDPVRWRRITPSFKQSCSQFTIVRRNVVYRAERHLN